MARKTPTATWPNVPPPPPPPTATTTHLIIIATTISLQCHHHCCGPPLLARLSLSLCYAFPVSVTVNIRVLGCTGTARHCSFSKGRMEGLDSTLYPNTFLARTSLRFHVYTTVSGSLSVGNIGCGVCYLRLCICVLVLLGGLSACLWVSVRMLMPVCSVCVSCAVMLVNCV